MTEEQIAELHDRVSAMTEEERLALDPIAYALCEYQQGHEKRGFYALANRVAALAAVDAVEAWNKTVLERD
jgi:hypothetical protein